MSVGSTATVTITGTIGPGNALTATVLKNVNRFEFDVVNNIFTYFQGGNFTPNYIGITAATTVTVTLSAAGGNYTVSVS